MNLVEDFSHPKDEFAIDGYLKIFGAKGKKLLLVSLMVRVLVYEVRFETSRFILLYY